jgi:pimeloyl-ACP methyl ester carboxylesterase
VKLFRLGLVGLVISVVAMAASACFVPVPKGSQARKPSPEPGWTECSGEVKALVARVPSGYAYHCKTVTVPQDWGNKDNGKTLGIKVMRARSADQGERIGSLLVNPGGPGGSGIDLAISLSLGLPTEITRRFDIVGFDPRGVGRSEPIKCFTGKDLDESFGSDPDPATQAEFDEVVAMTRRMVEACEAKYGPALSLFSTEQTARDMDQIRAELGEAKMTYLGYSYGTLLGATYAQLFPDKVRAFVLDGAVDPTLGTVEGSESQAKGFERAFTNFTSWCDDNASRCPIQGNARAVVTKLMEQAETRPLANRDGRKATPGWILWGVISAMYSKSDWPQLGSALRKLSDGQPAEIFRLADDYANRDSTGEYSNLFDANAAVNCADDGKPVTLDRIRALQGEWRSKYPLFGSALAVSLMTCALWPVERDPYPTGAATGAPPILVVGTKGDPATPYEQTPKLANMLGVGVVLTWEGEGHTAYPETRCITNAVNKYLLTVNPPAAGTSCPAA